MGKHSRGIQNNNSHSNEENEVVDTSGRFDATKPQFRPPKASSSKVALDNRFASVLTDPRFQLDIKDKYGRKSNSKKKKDQLKNRENLSEFYTVENEEDILTTSNDKHEKKQIASTSQKSEQKNPDENEARNKKKDAYKEKEKAEDPASRIAYLRALSRGEIDISSSSEDDESEQNSDDDDNDDDTGSIDVDVDGEAGILDPSSNVEDEIEITHDPSPYLGIMNIDWSHMRAVDIFTIVASFTPPGAVRSVCVYPSDFGIERMAADEKFGPVDVWKKPKKDESDKGHGIVISHTSDDESSEENASDAVDSDEEENDSIYDTEINGDVSEPRESKKKESDFDAEKLRAYEVSKLKYFFAVVELTSPEHADIAYKEVDGIEFEHSRAPVDVRTIPVDQIDSVITGRTMRDQATGIPGNYEPPDFVVNALQQTSVQCTWEAGDTEREKMLTKYVAGDAWGTLAEKADLHTYLASDVSSDEESDAGKGKGTKMRMMLGLDSDADDKSQESADTTAETDSESENDGGEGDVSKQVTFVPGISDLKDKLRLKLTNKESPKALTPWETYLEKKKEKKRVKRQEAAAKRKDVNAIRHNKKLPDNDGNDDDEFFADNDDTLNLKSSSQSNSQDELALLLAGDDQDEEDRNFDIRGIERLEKNKTKKLRGQRKKKEEKLASNVIGTNFKVDITDDRFSKVLDGADARFGIDRTDPNFRETSGMTEILEEQTRRRKKRRKNDTITEPKNTDSSSGMVGNTKKSSLDELVMSIKSKVK